MSVDNETHNFNNELFERAMNIISVETITDKTVDDVNFVESLIARAKRLGKLELTVSQYNAVKEQGRKGILCMLAFNVVMDWLPVKIYLMDGTIFKGAILSNSTLIQICYDIDNPQFIDGKYYFNHKPNFDSEYKNDEIEINKVMRIAREIISWNEIIKSNTDKGIKYSPTEDNPYFERSLKVRELHDYCLVYDVDCDKLLKKYNIDIELK